ncbi:hypothetical protein GCM10023075_16750 [Streptosporangium album]
MACFTVRGNAAAPLAAGVAAVSPAPAAVPEVLDPQAARPRERTTPATPAVKARNALIKGSLQGKANLI